MKKIDLTEYGITNQYESVVADSGGVWVNEQVKKYLGKYSTEIVELYHKLSQLILDSVSGEVEEMLWANMPSYYVEKSFIRLIPFKDHINIEAQTIVQHKSELADYKITPKGMLQISVAQEIPYEVLKQVFSETLDLGERMV